MTDRSFNRECPVCLEEMFDEKTGVASKEVAELICHHIIHSDCAVNMAQALNSDGQRYGIGGFGPRAGCPICGDGTSCWQSSKDIGFFPAYWVTKVEQALQSVKDNHHPHLPVPAERIRLILKEDRSSPEKQKIYLQPIEEDSTNEVINFSALDSTGFQGALKWGGSVRYGGQRIYSGKLHSRGIYKYIQKQKALWLWEWGDVIPGTLCTGCRLEQGGRRPAVFPCPHCHQSSETPNYCSNQCRDRHWAKHKKDCEMFQQEKQRHGT